MICRALAAVLACFMVCLGHTQSLRHGSGLGSLLSKSAKEANNQSFVAWPDIRNGDNGTQVHITFDYRNADAILIADKSVDEADMIAEGRRIAKEIRLPKTDFVWNEGTISVKVDLEFNDYLRHRGNHTEYTFDLGALRAAIERSRVLPKPIVFRVESEDADSAVLRLPGRPPETLTEARFIELKDMPAGSTLDMAYTLPWTAWPEAIGLLALLAYVAFAVPVMAIKHLRTGANSRPFGTVPPLDPDQVQARYDRTRPAWWNITRSLALPLCVLLMANKRLLVNATYLIPFKASSFSSPLLLLPLILPTASLPLIFLYFSRKDRKPEPILGPDDPPLQPMRGQIGLWIGLLIFLPVFASTSLWLRGVVTIEPAVRRAIIFSPLVLFFAFTAWQAARIRKVTRTELLCGDPVYDTVMAIAQPAGVRVRHVVRVTNPSVNAFATLTGTIGFTSALLRQCDADEIRAIAAHEVGHLRSRHVPKAFALSLGLTAGVCGLGWSFWERIPEALRVALSGPILTFFVLPLLYAVLLSPANRRRERVADQFAVQTTGDPELVIRALTKITTLNQSPFRLRKSDEMLNSHPSLESRIAAIRRDASSGEEPFAPNR